MTRVVHPLTDPAEPERDGRRPKARPHPALELQRKVGNRAATRVLQRTPVAPSAYLSGLPAAQGGDPEWDPQWTVALGRVAADVTPYTPPTIDDAIEADIKKVLAALKTLASLSGARPNMHKLAMDALRWVLGIESDGSSSGFGTLDTSGAAFSGRPAFPTVTQENVKVRVGQHRRHILAWHTMRRFAELAYAAQPKVVVGAIEQAYRKRMTGTDIAFAEAESLVFKEREKSKASGGYTAEEWLKMGLFVMNGNPRNLWAGKGSTNSAINTAQMHMTAALDKVTTFKQLGELATTWSKVEAKAVYKTATTLGAGLVAHHGTLAWSEWESKLPPKETEAEAVGKVVGVVKDWVVSNLEVDVMSDVKVQNEMTQDKLLVLNDPIQLISNVVDGKVDPARIEDWILASAITEFLKYT